MLVAQFSDLSSMRSRPLMRRPWRGGISLREPFRQPGKTALSFDPDGWSRRSSYIDHPNYERSASGFAGRRCGLRSDRREAPRSAPFLRTQRSDSKSLAARDAAPPHRSAAAISASNAETEQAEPTEGRGN